MARNGILPKYSYWELNYNFQATDLDDFGWGTKQNLKACLFKQSYPNINLFIHIEFSKINNETIMLTNIAKNDQLVN